MTEFTGFGVFRKLINSNKLAEPGKLSQLGKLPMDEDTFWEILEEILDFGEFIVAVANEAASANIVGRISVGRDGREKVIDKDLCHCHVHLKPEKIARFSFTYIDAGYGEEPCCELKMPPDETVLRLYLRADKETAAEKFAGFSFGDAEFVEGQW